jgi:serine/threonine protein kinase
VTVFDFEEENGIPYLVTEYLDGQNLQQLLEQGAALPILERLQTMSEAADGLQYAHEHGVIHRDAKPANIMRLTDRPVKTAAVTPRRRRVQVCFGKVEVGFFFHLH